MEKKPIASEINPVLSVTTPLLWHRSWTTRSRGSAISCKVSLSKTLLLLLFWEFSTSLIFNYFLNPYSYVQGTSGGTPIAFPAVIAFIFLFSPIAGFLADTKFTRFKMLVCSTYTMLLTSVAVAVATALLASIVHHANDSFVLVFILLCLAVLLYGCGRMIFVANILQFVMDQLRDETTTKSVFFLYLYLLCSNLSISIVLLTNIPGREFVVNSDTVALDTTRLVVSYLIMVFAISSMIVILVTIHKKRHWFLTEKITKNPYRQVYEVLRFAWLHKKPACHPSAFTYCEDVRPSRIDFGKRKYGGPFTTEEVEDVKVMLRMLTVLFPLGATFLMQQGVLTSILNHHIESIVHYKVHDPARRIFLDDGLMSPLMSVLGIVIFLAVVRPLFLRWIPSIFKRMTLSIVVICFSTILLLTSNTLAYDSYKGLNELQSVCTGRDFNSSYVLNFDLITFPSVYMLLLQHTLSSLHQMLLYISSWEFICSQTPQHMKGLMFGLFLSIKAFYEFITTVEVILFRMKWTSIILSCQSAFFLVNVVIGMLSLLAFTISARKYKYRKRDDICNYYQFAEDYYSK